MNAINAVFNKFNTDSDWPKSNESHKQLLKYLDKHNGSLYRKFYIENIDILKNKYNFDEDQDIRAFIKEYWLAFNHELIKLNNKDLNNQCVSLKIPSSGTGRGTNCQYSTINNILSQLTATADLILTFSNMSDNNLICKYNASNDTSTYFVYIHIANSGPDIQNKPDNRDVIICVVQGKKIINSITIPYPHNSTIQARVDFSNIFYQKFIDCNKDIFNKIKDEKEHDSKVIYSLEYNEENLKYYIDKYFQTGNDYSQYINELQEYSNQINDLYKQNSDNTNDNMSLSKQVSIEVYYSHINVLYQIIDKCQKAKVKYKFERIAKTKKRLLTKYALKNSDLLQTFNKVCNTNDTQLVATYYSKKIMDNNQIDENYCAGIIIKFKNIFLTIPSHAHSSFNNIMHEYNRVKDELSNRSIFKKVKDQFNNGANAAEALLSSNFSIRDIAANPYIRRDKGVYKYIIKNINGIKEFSSFQEANTFFKKYTYAQYIQIAPAFSYLNNNDTNIQEYKLRLTIDLTNNSKLISDIDRIISTNKQYILNIDEVNKILNSIKSNGLIIK